MLADKYNYMHKQKSLTDRRKQLVLDIARRVTPLLEDKMKLEVPRRFEEGENWIVGNPTAYNAEIINYIIFELGMFEHELFTSTERTRRFREWLTSCRDISVAMSETRAELMDFRGVLIKLSEFCAGISQSIDSRGLFNSRLNKIFLNERKIRMNIKAGLPFKRDEADVQHPNHVLAWVIAHELAHATHYLHFPRHFDMKEAARGLEYLRIKNYLEEVAEFYADTTVGEQLATRELAVSDGHKFMIHVKPYCDSPLVATARRLPTQEELANPQLYIERYLRAAA